MKVLFIGGTGNISTDCTREAIARGFEVYHLNRGNRGSDVSTNVTTFHADIRDAKRAGEVLDGERFDCVVDFIAFTPEHVRTDIDLFRGKVGQYIFISSASVYHKPPRHYVITESTPRYNPHWTYSQNKIACEDLLTQEYREKGFPMTIVRPSHTYSVGWLPTTFGSSDFTVPQRMLDGRPIVVHGDGTSLWTLTHTMDFAKGFTGLLCNPAAIGEAFHITSDEVLTWDQIHRTIGDALGVTPEIVHVPSDRIHEVDSKVGAGLIGDKAHSVVFDNTKIKRCVPGFQATIPFYLGARMSVDHLNRHADERTIDPAVNSLLDVLIDAR